MANTHDNLTELFSSIAAAIRSKTGSTAKIKADNFPSAISAIEAGGGGSGGGGGTSANLQYKRVTPTTSFQQVTYDSADGYTGLSGVGIEAIQTQSKEIWRNGTYLPDSGKFFDSVTVNILTDAKLGNATEYTFGQIGIMQTSVSVSFNIAETIHAEDGEIILDNPTSQTITMRSSDTSGFSFDGLKGMYFQKSGTTYYVPPDCTIVRSAVKGSGNATTGYKYVGSIYPVIVDAGTVMGTKNITANGTYYASDDGFDGFESVNVNVNVELPPIDVSRRGAASDLVSGKQLYDENRNLVTGTVREIAGDDFYVDDEFGVRGEMLTDSTVGATWPVSEDTLFRKGVPVEFRFPVSQLGISGGVELPPIDDSVRGTASDMVSGKKLYDDNGNLVTGTVEVGSDFFDQGADGVSAIADDGSIGLQVIFTKDAIYRKDDILTLWYYDVGNASADNVLQGTNFTSQRGVKIPGGMPNNGSVNKTIDGISTTSVSGNAGYYSGVSVTFDSSAIEALLDAL